MIVAVAIFLACCLLYSRSEAQWLLNHNNVDNRKRWSPWISVRDRLPEHGKSVLIHSACPLPYTEVGMLDHSGIWRFTYDMTEAYGITHWMPFRDYDEFGGSK